jgi:hypothetical protein
LQYAQKECHKNSISNQQIAPCADRCCLISSAERRVAGIALQLSADTAPPKRRSIYDFAMSACGT